MDGMGVSDMDDGWGKWMGGGGYGIYVKVRG